jgi:hypothetical protein
MKETRVTARTHHREAPPSKLRASTHPTDYRVRLGNGISPATEAENKVNCGSTLLKSAILAASLAVLPGTGAMAASDAAPKIDQCLDPEICPIPNVRLAKQESEPFLFQGKEVNVNYPWYSGYKKVLRRFPDVRSCLTTDEREKPQPDLRLIDWGAIGNTREIDVCVFRIASSIEDIKTIQFWLRHHGFSMDELSRRRRESYVPKYETEPLFRLWSYLSMEKFREVIPRSWFTRIIGLEIGRRYALYIDFSQNFPVSGMHSSLATKLDK